VHVSYGMALVPCVIMSILGAQVRFGHAPTSGFTRLPSVGGPGGGLPPGPGRNAALDHGLSPGMSPAMGGGASNMEMSRAMAARSTSGLTPSLTPGLSGSLSGLGARCSDRVTADMRRHDQSATLRARPLSSLTGTRETQIC